MKTLLIGLLAAGTLATGAQAQSTYIDSNGNVIYRQNSGVYYNPYSDRYYNSRYMSVPSDMYYNMYNRGYYNNGSYYNNGYYYPNRYRTTSDGFYDSNGRWHRYRSMRNGSWNLNW